MYVFHGDALTCSLSLIWHPSGMASTPDSSPVRLHASVRNSTTALSESSSGFHSSWSSFSYTSRGERHGHRQTQQDKQPGVMFMLTMQNTQQQKQGNNLLHKRPCSFKIVDIKTNGPFPPGQHGPVKPYSVWFRQPAVPLLTGQSVGRGRCQCFCISTFGSARWKRPIGFQLRLANAITYLFHCLYTC